MKNFLFIGLMIMLLSCARKIETPEILEGNKSHTLNGTGYVFFTPSQISREFLEIECTSGKRVLEIGAGFGDLPIEALKRGCSEYYANDISKDHLKILFHKAQQQVPDKLENLKIISGKVPDILKRIDKKFDAIIADKVIHFFTPTEIIEFLELAKTLLRKNGKLYITTASPYSKRYNRIRDDYLSRKKQGDDFPGYFTDVMERLNHSKVIDKNYQGYQVPDAMVLFAREDLVKLLEKHDMRVTQSYSLKIPTSENPEWLLCPDNESNISGVIAIKND